MPFALTEDHRALAEVAAALLADRKVLAAARDALDTPTEGLPPFWSAIAELGWLGLHLPESHGGQGYGLAELAVVVEAMGAVVAPGPFLPTVVAAALVDRRGVDDDRAALLPGLADGSTAAAVGLHGTVELVDGFARGDAARRRRRAGAALPRAPATIWWSSSGRPSR
ncbi:MAG: acyl-CoA dehydrogenase family protein [Acidimicrobiia bacterium]